MQPRRDEGPRRSRRKPTFLFFVSSRSWQSLSSLLSSVSKCNHEETKVHEDHEENRRFSSFVSSRSWQSLSSLLSSVSKCNHEETKLHEDHEEDNRRSSSWCLGLFVPLRSRSRGRMTLASAASYSVVL